MTKLKYCKFYNWLSWVIVNDITQGTLNGKETIILFRGEGVWGKFASPSIFCLTLKRRMHVHSWNFFTFNIYIYNTFWQNFMVVGGCVQKLWPFWYSTLVENQNFLVKTLKNWMCYKIKSLDSFSLKFWHNTHNNDTEVLKKWNYKNFKFWSATKKSRFSRFFGTKISRSGFN